MRKFEELVNIINTKHPEWKTLSVRSLKDISGYSHDTSRLALNEVRPNNDQTPKTTKQKIPKSTNKNPPQGIEETFIDDPNELLMSCTMRELNKPDPDVQWGRILLTLLDKTGRLETKTAQEVMVRSKLVKYSSNQLIELRKRLTSS